MATNIIETIVKLKDEVTPGLQTIGKNVNSAAETMQKLGVQSAVAGAAITTALGMAINSSTAYAESLDRISKMNDINAETLARLGYAAELEHSSLQGLGTAFKFLGRSMASAQEGSDEAKKAFEKIGIAVTDASGRMKKTDAVFNELIDKMGTIGSSAERTKLLMTLLGRSGAELGPFFKLGADEIRRLGEEAVKLGAPIGKEIAQLDMLKDQFEKVQKGSAGISKEITMALMPSLLLLTSAALETSKTVIAWIKENRELAATILKVVGAVGIVLTVFGSLMAAGATVVTIFGAIAASISSLVAAGKALMGIAVVAKTVTALVAAATGLFTASTAVIIALVISIIVVFYRLRNDFVTIWGDIKNGVKNTVDALSTYFTKLKNDASVVVEFVINIFERLLNMITEGLGYIPKIGPMLSSMFSGLRADAATIAGFLKDKAVDVGAAVADAAKKGAAGAKNVAANLKDSTTDAFDFIKEKFGNMLDIKLLKDIEEAYKDAMNGMKAAGEEAAATDAAVKSEMLRGWESVVVAQQSYAYQVGAAFGTMYNGIIQGFGNAMAQMIMTGKSFAETFKSIINSLLQQLLASLISMLAKSIIEQTLFAQKEIALSKASGMAKAAAAPAGIPFVGIGLGIVAAYALARFIDSVAKFGDGGVVTKPTLAIVGEKGPERITPLAKENSRISTSSGGNTFNIIVNADSRAGTLEEIADAARAGTRQAVEAALLMSRLAAANEGLA